MDGDARVRAFWQKYLESLPDSRDAERRFYECFHIGDTPESADAGAELIRSGAKTATSTLLWEYQASGHAPPTPGALSIVQNGRGDPVCVVETREVGTLPFADVDADFARDYGEWDGTLVTWRQRCWNYYSACCRRLGQEPSGDMLLVCERFRVVFP